MYVNRFTISLDSAEELALGVQKGEFNAAAAYFEELFHMFRKRRLDAAGYGFIHFTATSDVRTEQLKHGGQRLMFTKHSSHFDGFGERTPNERLTAFCQFAREAINSLAEQLPIDHAGFMEAIDEIEKEGVTSIIPLRISRWSKDRKLQVVFSWERQMGPSPLRLIVLTRNEEFVKEVLISDDISFWILAHDWRKSEWNGRALIVRDRSGRVTMKFDLSDCWR